MAFLTLNSTTIRVKSNAADQKDNEHRVDRERMFDGTMRVFRGPIFRQWDITTAILTPTDYATVRALVNSNSALSASGDFIGGTVNVMPVPGSWTPVQSPGISGGFGWVGKFTLHENPTPVPVDTSAVLWAFYRRGHGYWQDRAGTIAAGDGDKVDRWDDASGNSRHLMSHDGNPSDEGEAGWAGSLDYRPYRDVAQNAIKLGFSDNVAGWTEMRPPRVESLDELTILFGVRAYADPDVDDLTIITTRQGFAGDRYPDTLGHIKIGFGLSTVHDAGNPAVDLTGWNCLELAGSNLTNELHAYLNGTEILSYTLGGSEAFVWNQSTDASFGPLMFNGAGNFRGWARDVAFVAGLLTPTQRTAWTNYILGVTSSPPII